MSRISLALSVSFLALLTIVVTARDGFAVSCSGWTQVTSPLASPNDNVLAAISGSSTSDIWAVGDFAPGNDPNTTRTLTQHYDGTAWSIVPSPNAGTLANSLFGVTSAAGKAWAVGYYLTGTTQAGDVQPSSLIEEWDGTAWTISSHPSPGTLSHLFGVSAISANDVWAVGESQVGSGVFSTLIEHFDGTAWSVVPSPNPGINGNHLNSVVALSTDDAWAVGQSQGSAFPNPPLIEHWNGSAWSVVTSPTLGNLSGLPYSVSGADSDLFLIGETQSDRRGTRTLAESEVNGTWQLESSSNVGSGDNHLYALSTLGGGLAYAAGTFFDPSNGNLFTLIERRDTSGWVTEPSPSPGQANNGGSQLGGVLAIDSSDVWAVGTYDGANSALPLILRRCQ